MKFEGEFEKMKQTSVKHYDGQNSGTIFVPREWEGREVIVLLLPDKNNGNE